MDKLLKEPKIIITVKEARKVLGSIADNYSDKEILILIKELDQLAKIIIHHT